MNKKIVAPAILIAATLMTINLASVLYLLSKVKDVKTNAEILAVQNREELSLLRVEIHGLETRSKIRLAALEAKINFASELHERDHEYIESSIRAEETRFLLHHENFNRVYERLSLIETQLRYPESGDHGETFGDAE